MNSLTKIEQQIPSRRSSFIGQAGVLQDLKSLPRKEAVEWLGKNIASPVTSDWGKLLVYIGAEWSDIKGWLQRGKEHSIAVADAIELSVILKEELLAGCSAKEAELEIEKLVNLYSSPKLKKIQQVLIEFNNPKPLHKDLQKIANIIFGESINNIHVNGKDKAEKWHSLLHKASGKYCVSILDWKSSEEDILAEILSAPIRNSYLATELVVESINVGSDESIFVTLPVAAMQELKSLAPKAFKFSSVNLQPNKSLKDAP